LSSDDSLKINDPLQQTQERRVSGRQEKPQMLASQRVWWVMVVVLALRWRQVIGDGQSLARSRVV